MLKILVLPLDERPCNISYAKALFHHENIELILPDIKTLGNKKKPASYDSIKKYLLNHIKQVDGAVLSIDMLLYGGLVPSRLHHLSKAILQERLNFLDELKRINSKLIIYAFDLVMRCPQYNSNDEEPDYYAQFGKNIFLSGYYKHKSKIQLITKDEEVIQQNITIPEAVLQDYLERRTCNNMLNLQTLKKVSEGIIEYLIIPQDDAAEYGYTSLDQESIKTEIQNRKIQEKVAMYPGADETVNTLVSKMIMKLLNKRHHIYVHYITSTTPETIPLLEDKSLDYTINAHIMSSGANRVYSENIADSILFVNGPAFNMMNTSAHQQRSYQENQFRNLDAFIDYIDMQVQFNRNIGIADVFNLNGSDYELMNKLNSKKLLNKIQSYGGWNTSSNTLGTVIPMLNANHLFGSEPLKSFLMLRYVEDYGYMTFVKNSVNQKLSSLKMNYFDVSKDIEIVEKMIKDELNEFINQHLNTIKDNIKLNHVWMPWKRMFEVGLEIDYKKDA